MLWVGELWPDLIISIALTSPKNKNDQNEIWLLYKSMAMPSGRHGFHYESVESIEAIHTNNVFVYVLKNVCV